MSSITQDAGVNELLISTSPEELATAQGRMILNVELKRDDAIVEAKQAHDLLEQCTAARLSVTQARSMHKRATARVTFLTNTLTALQAGYCMMPDMPGEVVMVRTNRTFPHPSHRRDQSYVNGVPYVQPTGLPAGEGRYVRKEHGTRNRQITTGKDSQGRDITKTVYWADRFVDVDGLPKKFMRPAIIERITGAARLHVFDEVVCIGHQGVERRKCKDPIVLGRIFNPVTKTVAAFLIAHFIDTAEL